MQDKIHHLEKLIVRTQLIRFHSLGSNLPSCIYLKPENLQCFGSYKIRGIASVVKHSDPQILMQGLAAASAGNMAQAVAFAAQLLSIPCCIYLPETAPAVKKNMIQTLGAELVELPYQEVWQLVRNNNATSAGVFIHPAYNEALLQGYATIAQEILEDMPDVDAIVIPFGVGGLSLGISQMIKKHNPHVTIYACEPETAAPLKSSLQNGYPSSVDRIPSFVDAIGTPEVLPQVFQQLSPLLQDSLVMPLSEIKQALAHLFLHHKLVCEGAAACSLAAAIQLAKQRSHHKIVCILSGGNIDMDILKTCLS